MAGCCHAAVTVMVAQEKLASFGGDSERNPPRPFRRGSPTKKVSPARFPHMHSSTTTRHKRTNIIQQQLSTLLLIKQIYPAGGSRLSTVPSQKPRQLSHLQAQLAQLTANMSDLESLMRMTAGQAQDMRGLGGYAGAM